MQNKFKRLEYDKIEIFQTQENYQVFNTWLAYLTLSGEVSLYSLSGSD